MPIHEDRIVLTGDAVFRISEEEFFHLCQLNRDLRIERNSKREIIIMPPTGGETGRLELVVGTQLSIWNQRMGLGFTFSSSAGFTLPDGSVLSPDAAWVARERWEQLKPEERSRFAPLVPDFVVEVRSPSDSLDWLKDKMAVYMRSGCRLGWLLSPPDEKAFLYHADGHVQEVNGFGQRISADPVLPGFEMDLSLLR